MPMRFNREKYIDLIMYVISQCHHKPNFGKTVLCSILYFIDFNYYEIYGELLTNETYVKSKRGIRPAHFREITEELISKKYLFFRKEPYYSRTIYRYHLIIIPNLKFSKRELEIIDYSIRKLSNENATTITKYAKRDPPISLADFGEEIDFRHVLSRDGEYSMIDN
jgi:hypothetical protein